MAAVALPHDPNARGVVLAPINTVTFTLNSALSLGKVFVRYTIDQNMPDPHEATIIARMTIQPSTPELCHALHWLEEGYCVVLHRNGQNQNLFHHCKKDAKDQVETLLKMDKIIFLDFQKASSRLFYTWPLHFLERGFRDSHQCDCALKGRVTTIQNFPLKLTLPVSDTYEGIAMSTFSDTVKNPSTNAVTKIFSVTFCGIPEK